MGTRLINTYLISLGLSYEVAGLGGLLAVRSCVIDEVVIVIDRFRFLIMGF